MRPPFLLIKKGRRIKMKIETGSKMMRSLETMKRLGKCSSLLGKDRGGCHCFGMLLSKILALIETKHL
jgi:hypothetical protein